MSVFTEEQIRQIVDLSLPAGRECPDFSFFEGNDIEDNFFEGYSTDFHPAFRATLVVHMRIKGNPMYWLRIVVDKHKNISGDVLHNNASYSRGEAFTIMNQGKIRDILDENSEAFSKLIRESYGYREKGKTCYNCGNLHQSSDYCKILLSKVEMPSVCETSWKPLKEKENE